ncbi:hypothetical protein FAZ78_23820 [Cereibacter changlensis]|uniref:Uncharacterized protein n=1 Tax=Cereibacter changlensis TaxID=402884 RepID=A0A4V5NL36_9RHOB|nr:hypothetical protein [Cereibacter changlensis]TKA94167.1 hypothetical protein FAZ78_23820 [Cereibacter changlensis]
MNQEIELYLRCLREIKMRLDFVREDYVRPASLEAVPIMKFENACLQVRKVVEYLAFASLASNRQLYETEWSGFVRENDFSKLLRRLQKINPQFLPTSVSIEGLNSSGEWLMKDNEFQLEPHVLTSTYGRLGNVLHAKNPYSDSTNWEEYQTFLRQGVKAIISAIQDHVAILATGEHLLVRMSGNDQPIQPYILRER